LTIQFQLDLIVYGIIDSVYRKDKKCKLTLAKSPMDVVYTMVQLLKKDSPYTKAINEWYNSILSHQLKI